MFSDIYKLYWCFMFTDTLLEGSSEQTISQDFILDNWALGF